MGNSSNRKEWSAASCLVEIAERAQDESRSSYTSRGLVDNRENTSPFFTGSPDHREFDNEAGAIIASVDAAAFSRTGEAGY